MAGAYSVKRAAPPLLRYATPLPYEEAPLPLMLRNNQIQPGWGHDSAHIVAAWLFVLAGLVFLMALIGAITRLSGSGLSIAEWRPVVGVLPPLSEAEWKRLFALYQETPEFRIHNSWMLLEDFRTIFWWEWVHRLWGHLIAIAFAGPLVWLWATRRISPDFRRRLLGLLLLGGAQGVVGWLMVASGLVDRPAVSHYRLALHLGLAMLIFAALIRTALGLVCVDGTALAGDRKPWFQARVTLGLTLITIAWGAFVAGKDAGLAASDFPTVNGYWLVPELAGGLTALVENEVAIQWMHRVLALGTFVLTILFWLRLRDGRFGEQVAWLGRLLVFAVLLQATMGALTVQTHVAHAPAVLHQAGAFVIIGLWAAMFHFLRWPVTGERLARASGV